MIIKLINMNKSYPAGEGVPKPTPDPVRDTYVLEADSYRVKCFQYASKGGFDKIFSDNQEFQGAYRTVFGGINANLVTSDAFGEVLWLAAEGEMPIVASCCAVFVMNDDGKTVDKLEIA